MVVEVNDRDVAELYVMVQWWCHERSNTFQYVAKAIEECYPGVAERNKVEFE